MPTQLALFGSTNADRSGARLRPLAPPTSTTTLRAPPALRELEREAERYVQEAHAKRTREAYQADWSAFEAWCQSQALDALPASVHTLELYLTRLAKCGRKASTIRRARVSIGLAHAYADVARPDRHPRIRTLERGIGRVHGVHEEGAPPLLDEQLALVVRTLGRSPRDDRDRALLLLGFAAAMRRSELSGLDIPDVTFTETGLELRVRRSKEDQLGRGAVTQVPLGSHPDTCPVRALKLWLGRVGRPAGPLFRVIRGTIIEHERMHPKAATRAVQRAVARAGLAPVYSSHSLRAGLATSAYAHGATEREIQLQGRWRDARSLHRYIQIERVPGRKNVADGLL